MIDLDDLDRKVTIAFEGHVVRKDLVRQFRGQFPVPTYVVEFMLGRYCASTDEQEIDEGLEMVRNAAVDRARCAPARRSCSSRARARRARCG